MSPLPEHPPLHRLERRLHTSLIQVESHPCEDIEPRFRTPVARWCRLVATHAAQHEIERWLRVIDCESGGNPRAKNPTSTASGLLQHLTNYWPERARRAGVPGASVWDPVAQVIVSVWLRDNGGWGHWPNCGRGR